MKQQVFYIHGGEAYSDYKNFLQHLKTAPISLPGEEVSKRWSRSLADDLGGAYEVFTPVMPSKHNAKYEEWKIWFERYFEYLRDGVILVGWSQGGLFLSKYLLENQVSFAVKKLILVASPYEKIVFGDDLEDGGDFFYDTRITGELAAKVKNIVIFHSKDDFVVPFAHGKALAKALPQAKFRVFEDKNHFLIEEFPELLAEIRD